MEEILRLVQPTGGRAIASDKGQGHGICGGSDQRRTEGCISETPLGGHENGPDQSRHGLPRLGSHSQADETKERTGETGSGGRERLTAEGAREMAPHEGHGSQKEGREQCCGQQHACAFLAA